MSFCGSKKSIATEEIKKGEIFLVDNLGKYMYNRQLNMFKETGKRFIFGLLVLGLVTLPLFLLPKNAFAIFSLSVSPYEGGYDLRYGKVSSVLGRVNKEVTININSDIGKQYRLVQTNLEPLETPEGRFLPQNSLVVYGIRGTNKYGTINVEQEVPVTLGRQVLYTSNQSGAPDSFTLVYGLIASSGIEPGSYRGRIGFMLESVDLAQSPVTVILNIYADIEAESAIDIKTASGTKSIELKPQIQENSASSVVVQIRGGFGKQFRILQLVSEQPISSDGLLLDWEAINFIGRDAQKGMVINELSALSSRPQIIYTSSLRGETDNFVIEYSLGELSKQKAGRYRTRIKYILEGVGFAQNRLIDTLGLEIDIPRMFDLVVTPEIGGVIQFRDIKPQQPPKIQEVIFQVQTNVGKQYQVTQNALSLLTSKEGKVISSQYFTLRQEGLETKGTIKYPQKSEIKEGQMVLFVSDKQGSSDKFKVIYELTAPPDVHFGDYSATLTYSVSEI